MLRLRNIRKTFGSIVAVDDLSLDIERGEVFGLLGPNGAGKTTTVNMAIGLMKPDRGSIEFDGKGSPVQAEIRANIGVAPQSLAIYDELSGEENLSFFGKIHGLAGKNLKGRIEWALDFVDLTERCRDRVKTYSGGMKRRLNLAIALIHDPQLLLLDEPTVGVDPQSRNAIFEKIETMRREGRTIVYTTHYIEEAERLCDRVAILDNGKILALDTVEGLLSAYGGKDVVIAEGPEGDIRIETDDPLAELVQLKEEGLLKQFRLERPNLEGVFLNLTGKRLRD